MSLGSESYAVKRRFVASGRFGDVYTAERITDSKVIACKTIRYDKTPAGRGQIENEVTVLGRLYHPNIVHYYKVVWLQREAQIYTEYCDGLNLDDFIKANFNDPAWPAEKQLWDLILQLSAALTYCHRGLYRDDLGRKLADHVDDWNRMWPQVLHRDIKPHNVFLRRRPDDRMIYKLGDFGLATILSDDLGELTFAGTLPYCSPEITRDSPKFSVKSDIYAFGCTLYYFLYRRPPFSGQLTSLEPVPALPERMSPEVKDLIKKCISYEPGPRPEAVEIFTQASSHHSDEELMIVSIQTQLTFNSEPMKPTSSATTNGPAVDDRSARSMPQPIAAVMPRQSVDSWANVATRNEQHGTISPLTRSRIVSSAPTTHQPEASQQEFGAMSPSTTLQDSSSAPTTYQSEASQQGFGIGNLVTDIYHYPSVGSKTFRGGRVITTLLTNEVEFVDVQVESMPKVDRKSDFWPTSSKKSQLKKYISLVADSCYQHALQDIDDYFAEVSRAYSLWLHEQLESGKNCYLAIGCLAYEGARVSVSTESSKAGSRSSSAIIGEIPHASASGVPLSFTSESQQKGDSKFVMRGHRVQAGYFMEIAVDRSYSRRYVLGRKVVTYFWGPQRSPILDHDATSEPQPPSRTWKLFGRK